jgi:hypothetical protein
MHETTGDYTIRRAAVMLLASWCGVTRLRTGGDDVRRVVRPVLWTAGFLLLGGCLSAADAQTTRTSPMSVSVTVRDSCSVHFDGGTSRVECRSRRGRATPVVIRERVERDTQKVTGVAAQRLTILF